MKISIVLFASARELVGSKSVEVDVPEWATVRELRVAVLESFPELGNLLSTSVFSVDHEYAHDEFRLFDGAEVAMIPPVSGG